MGSNTGKLVLGTVICLLSCNNPDSKTAKAEKIEKVVPVSPVKNNQQVVQKQRKSIAITADRRKERSLSAVERKTTAETSSNLSDMAGGDDTDGPETCSRFSECELECPDGAKMQKISVGKMLTGCMKLFAIPHGKMVVWYSENQKDSEGYYIDGQINGYYRKWYGNGVLKVEKEFVGGILEGIWSEWYPNGQLRSRGYIKMGIPTGPHITRYDDGNPARKTVFSWGNISQKVCWDRSGKESNCENVKRDLSSLW